ncbi:hypothetical protein AUP68_16662 [Ilyonectria robusta]
MCELVERRETCEKCRSVAGVQTELDPCESAMQSGENCANTRKTSENKYVPKTSHRSKTPPLNKQPSTSN